MADNLQSNSVHKKKQGKDKPNMEKIKPILSQNISTIKEEGDMTAYIMLAGSIIGQAITDGMEYTRILKYKLTPHPSTIEVYKDGHNFIMSNRLNDFISTFRLGLEPEFIRNKYKGIIYG